MIILVHGWRVGDGGAGTVDTFAEPLKKAGLRVDPHYADYGKLFLTRFGRIKSISEALAYRLSRDFPAKSVTLICHSNGLAIAHECIKHTSAVKTIISFNGALNADASFSHTVDRVINFHSPHDWVLKWGAWLRPFHSWGRAGQSGLSSADPRITNICMDDVKGHSKVFQVKSLREKYAQKVIDLVK